MKFTEPALLFLAFIAAAWFLLETKVAGIYAVLATTMWMVGIVYGLKVLKAFRQSDLATLLIMLGISFSFTGHAIDQTIWASANVSKAITGDVSAVSWAINNLPILIVFGKGLAVLGGLMHLRLAVLEKLPWLKLKYIILIWLVAWSFLSVILR